MSEVKVEIIYEDDDLLVLNKPAGIVVNNSDSAKGESLQDWVEKYLNEKKCKFVDQDWKSLVPENFSDEYGTPEEIFIERRGMVHRLDKDTSGVIVFAKNPGSLVNLLAQFRERKTNKRYLCMVHGCPRFDSFTINAPLGRARIDRKKFAVTVDGREAVTEYKVIKKIPFSKEFFEPFLGEKSSLSLEEKKLLRKNLNLYQAGFALVNCWPKTGRTHQIRVHMAHVQNPLVGDTVYVGRKRANIDPLWCTRQFLHAERLELVHPRSGERVEFEAGVEGKMKLLV